MEKEEIVMQNSNSQIFNKSVFTVIGLLIGAVIALVFAKTGSPGLIGVGSILGMFLGKALDRRFNKNI